MHFVNLNIGFIAVLTTLVAAAPAPAPQSLNLELITRANSKLNQYSNPNCLDNNGGNVPTYHASPPARKCYDIDSTTVSFFFGLGPLSQTWVYSAYGCTGLSVNLGGSGGCEEVNANFSNGFPRIYSLMMD